MKKAVIYARVSSTNERQDTSRQIKDLENYAKSQGIEIVKIYEVGSANNAFPLYSGRFSLTCPRTVLTRLHVYGSPSVTSFYLSQLWIFALHSAHTTKVFLCI